MADWTNQISGCFGEVDREFAVHGLDEERAFELLKLLRERRTSWDEAKERFREFLKEDGCSQDHIDRQMKRIRRYMKVWLQ